MTLLNNQPVEYLSCDIANRTTYKSVKDGYERNYFSVIKQGSIFWVEGNGCPDRTYNLVIKETKRLYPNLVFLHDMDKPKSCS